MDCARTMSRPSSVVSLLFFCLLVLQLPAQHGASNHTSYKLGSRQVFFRSPGDSQQASTVPTATTCSSSITTGLGKNKLPVVHRQRPCSPLYGLPSLRATDAMRHGTSPIRRRFASQSGMSASAPSPAETVNIPANGSLDPSTLWGALDYSVLVGYGTPEQQFPVFLDTSLGTSVLRCTPCASDLYGDCDPAFDPLQSYTFANVACGSLDCPANCSVGSICLFHNSYYQIEGSFPHDVLNLAPSVAIHDFRFVCQTQDDGRPSGELPVAGTLDLSRDRSSVPSRLSSSSSPALFSYCLPQSPSSQGFLSLGGDGTIRDEDDNRTVHGPLLSNPEAASMYFIDLVGMSLGGEDLPILAETFGVNGTILDVANPFTVLAPDAYTALRDAFRKEMSRLYKLSSMGFASFDTCYNFTGMDELTIPLVRFLFSNGESLLIDGDQMLYYDDAAAAPFTLACLAFSAVDPSDDGDGYSFSAIGSYTLASMEVVYDVAGGNVGFIPDSC